MKVLDFDEGNPVEYFKCAHGVEWNSELRAKNCTCNPTKENKSYYKGKTEPSAWFKDLESIGVYDEARATFKKLCDNYNKQVPGYHFTGENDGIR